MNASETMFTALLRSALNRQPPRPEAGVDWTVVFELAASSETLFAVYKSIMRLPPEAMPGDEMLRRFRAGADKALYTDALQGYAFESIQNALSDAGVSFCPLKGLVLRTYYPQSAMRSMFDADILIHPQDKPRAKEIMLEAGYTFKLDNGTHMLFSKPPMLLVELHETPLSEHSRGCEAMRDLWEHLEPMDKCRYRIPHALHYVYLLLHLDKHLNESGFGVRVMMDFWVLRQTAGDLLQDEAVRACLRDIDLLGLAQGIRGIEGAWFDGDPLPEKLRAAEDWIVQGGVYGSEAQLVIRFMENHASAPRQRIGIRYILGRFFLPMPLLRLKYRELDKYPLLYPVCLVRRWLNLLKKRNLIQDRVSTLSQISPEQVLQHERAIRALYTCGSADSSESANK